MTIEEIEDITRGGWSFGQVQIVNDLEVTWQGRCVREIDVDNKDGVTERIVDSCQTIALNDSSRPSFGYTFPKSIEPISSKGWGVIEHPFEAEEENYEKDWEDLENEREDDYLENIENSAWNAIPDFFLDKDWEQENLIDKDYFQEIEDLGKKIKEDPANPLPYLERGIAYFHTEQYERSLKDYDRFSSLSTKDYDQFPTASARETRIFVSQFADGFVKGLPKGIYESGKGLLLFMMDFVKHPIHTSKQIIDSMTTLAQLTYLGQWNIIADSLCPELHQLASHWYDSPWTTSLPPEELGELAGYALGKHGTDILLPGAFAKLAARGARHAADLKACLTLQRTPEILLLETAAEIGNSTKIAEVVNTGQKTAFLAEELGLAGPEMGQLKAAGKLETTVAASYDSLSPLMQESVSLHNKAKEALKPYMKKPLPESQVRELIHKTGIPTFPRPKGIPEDFLVMVSDRGGGMEYVHPTNTHIRIRVMPGKPHSPFSHQQKPYVVQKMYGKAFDTQGNLVSQNLPNAHIPLDEFVYRK